MEALVNAFLVLLFGSIAFGIVSGIWRDMTPSLPPGFDHPKSVEAESSGTPHGWHFTTQHRFVLVFAVLFSVSAWSRLSGRSDNSQTSDRVQEFRRRISNEWFGLIVRNAFGAMIAAMVLVWVQKFSISQILFQWAWTAVWPPIQTIFGRLLGDSGGTIQAWFGWYGANQFKFTFWFLYLTAICDDLGLPNLKTVARFLWRRVRKRDFQPPPASAPPTGIHPAQSLEVSERK